MAHQLQGGGGLPSARRPPAFSCLWPEAAGRRQAPAIGHRPAAPSVEAVNTRSALSQLLTSCQWSAANKRQRARQRPTASRHRPADSAHQPAIGQRVPANSHMPSETDSSRWPAADCQQAHIRRPAVTG